MLIPRKGLPRHCKPCPVTKTHSVSTLAGWCTDSQTMVLFAMQLPELDKDGSLSSIKHLGLMVIADFLTKSSIKIKQSSRTMKWFNCKLPM